MVRIGSCEDIKTLVEPLSTSTIHIDNFINFFSNRKIPTSAKYYYAIEARNNRQCKKKLQLCSISAWKFKTIKIDSLLCNLRIPQRQRKSSYESDRSVFSVFPWNAFEKKNPRARDIVVKAGNVRSPYLAVSGHRGRWSI